MNAFRNFSALQPWQQKRHLVGTGIKEVIGPVDTDSLALAQIDTLLALRRNFCHVFVSRPRRG